MKNFKFLFLPILVVALMFSSCKKDDDTTVTTPVNESELLATYLGSTNSPLGIDVTQEMPKMILAEEVKTKNLTGQVYIIDIRSAADFALGHIENAHNVAFTDLLNHVETTDLSSYEKIAVVCYSGQTASYGTSLLRLMGHTNVYAMKWGMCSWNAQFASAWQNTIANGNAYAAQFTADEAAKAEVGSLPSLSTGETDPQKILEARVATVLAAGFGEAKVSNSSVFASLDNYYIVNYWPATHYADPGHIPGSIQYTPKVAIHIDTDLKTLPTDKEVVIYCYTGQTSAFMTAYLRVLGYNAKSLLYGANGMVYDDLVTGSLTHFDDHYIMGYDYIVD